MNENITLITAFFDIGREGFKAIPRSNKKYLEYFKYWARMKNHLIVYTSKQYEAPIKGIRENFGLGELTTIIVIDSIENIDANILRQMRNVSKNGWFIDFRMLPNATSNIAEYSYLMLLKTWFLQDAVSRGIVSRTIAWIDFGFNHGGDLYTHPEDFDFEWNYTFSRKIHLYYYQKLDEKPIFEIVRRLCDCFMGCFYVLPCELAGELWKLTRDAMTTLLDVGLIDDDQLLLLMAYRKRPELFEVEKSDWFLPLKEHGATHLRTKSTVITSWWKKPLVWRANLIRRARKRKVCKAYCNVTFNNLFNKE